MGRTDRNINTLPRWASDKIRRLERRVSEFESLCNALSDKNKDSPYSVEIVSPSGGFLERNLPDSLMHVEFGLDDVQPGGAEVRNVIQARIDTSFCRGGKIIEVVRVSTQDGVLTVFPAASNAAYIGVAR